MIRSLFKLAVFLVIAVVGYNYLFGDEAEKEQSKEIIGKASDLGKDAWNLLRGEQAKFKEGKYDDAVDKLAGLYESLLNKAIALKDSKAIKQIKELEAKRKDIVKQLESSSEEERAAAKKQLEKLSKNTEILMNEFEAAHQ